MTLANYLNDINSYPLLTQEQEKKLALEAQQGNKKARETFITSNLRLVINIAKGYNRNGQVLDLIQAGNIGLLVATDKFDPNLGYRFSTYASWWINLAIKRYIESDHLIPIPETAYQIGIKIYQHINQKF